MKLEIPVFLGFLLAVLFIGVVGGFLLYVPPLSILTVATMLLGLGFMFALGLQTGRKWRKLSRHANRSTFSTVQ
jgi:hypothetical protein